MSSSQVSDEAPPGEVRRHVNMLKRIRRFDQLCARLISCEEHEGYLMPVCDLHRGDARVVVWLARWREENAFAFPSQFPVTREGTARWLERNILGDEDRMLFLVLDRFGHAVGHVGCANHLNERPEMEIENVVRGVKDRTPGLMSRAVRAMLGWGRGLGVTRFHLRVFNDNEHAVWFYRRLGFRDDGLLPLRRHREGEKITYRPLAEGDTAVPDAHFLLMARDPT